MRAFVSSLRVIARPISLGVMLVAGLHLAIGVLAVRALVHPATPAPPQVAIAVPPPVVPVISPPSAVAVVPATLPPAATKAPSTVAPTPSETSDSAAAPLRGHATILDPMLLARESNGLAQLRAAGVNLETLLHHAVPKRRATDEGGPLVPLAEIRDAALDPGRLARLEQLIARMPFAAPLARYEISSRFGIRCDPFDGEPAFHSGIDLEAEYGEAVYSTAPGRVVFAGWDGAYGRMIEIDHGNGVHTRYGHLSRVLVRYGDRVVEHQRIGLVGSTGRSTGPHLHYEVRIDGRPLNPWKFLAAGRRFRLVKVDAER